MSIALFAMLGAYANAGAWYWICFGLYCAGRVTVNAVKLWRD